MSERSAQNRVSGNRESGDHVSGSTRTTQLRLLQSERPRPLRARKATPRARRTVHWESQWRLDARTRRVGQQGVASAREALARASHDELRRAS